MMFCYVLVICERMTVDDTDTEIETPMFDMIIKKQELDNTEDNVQCNIGLDYDSSLVSMIMLTFY